MSGIAFFFFFLACWKSHARAKLGLFVLFFIKTFPHAFHSFHPSLLSRNAGMLLITWIRLKAKLHEDPQVLSFTLGLQVLHASNTAVFIA